MVPSSLVSTENSATAVSRQTRGSDGGSGVEQQHLFEADVTDFGYLAQDFTSGDQRHLAVGGPGKRRDTVDLVIGKPRRCVRADLGLPDVALGLFLQADVLSQQRMDRHRAAAVGRTAWTLGQDQLTVGPGRQRGVHEVTSGIERREVDRGSSRMKITQQSMQSVRERLLTAHTGQCRHRRFVAEGSLLDCAGEQRMR